MHLDEAMNDGWQGRLGGRTPVGDDGVIVCEFVCALEVGRDGLELWRNGREGEDHGWSRSTTRRQLRIEINSLANACPARDARDVTAFLLWQEACRVWQATRPVATRERWHSSKL